MSNELKPKFKLTDYSNYGVIIVDFRITWPHLICRGPPILTVPEVHRNSEIDPTVAYPSIFIFHHKYQIGKSRFIIGLTQ